MNTHRGRVRFVLDHDVDTAVRVLLRRRGHESWTAGEAGLATASDDELTVYAHDQRAVLITHDREFSRRRKHNVIGRHLWLRCREEDAVALLDRHLDDVVTALFARSDTWVRISSDGMDTSSEWR